MDELIAKRIELALCAEIPDMAVYADKWNLLAAQFELFGAVHNAENCRARWRYYRQMDNGCYRRHVITPYLVELRQVVT